jgi:CBS domain-containing protein
VVDAQGNLLGVVTRSNLLQNWVVASLGSGPEDGAAGPIVAYDLIGGEPITAVPWESCRIAAERMAATGVGRLPVVSAEDQRKVLGIVTRSDLLKPRARSVEEEAMRRRYIDLGAVGARGPRG